MGGLAVSNIVPITPYFKSSLKGLTSKLLKFPNWSLQMRQVTCRHLPYLLALGLALPVQAAQVGQVTVESKTGKPLSAVVELIPAAGETNLKAKLASSSVFAALGAAYGPVVSSTTLQMTERNGRPAILIRSGKPVFEPISLVFDLESDAGQTVKKVVLKPEPGSEPISAPPVAAPSVQTAPVQSNTSSEAAQRLNKDLLEVKRRTEALESTIANLTAAINRTQNDPKSAPSKQDREAREARDAAVDQQLAMIALAAEEANRPWFKKITSTEWGILGSGILFLSFVGGAIATRFRRTPMLIAEHGKVRVVGLSSIPLEGELIRGKDEVVLEVKRLPNKMSLLQKLGFKQPPSAIFSVEQELPEAVPAIPSGPAVRAPSSMDSSVQTTQAIDEINETSQKMAEIKIPETPAEPVPTPAPTSAPKPAVPPEETKVRKENNPSPLRTPSPPPRGIPMFGAAKGASRS